MRTEKIVVLHSGGLDSTVLLHRYIFEEWDVYPLAVNYGQKHLREISAASKIIANAEMNNRWMQVSVPLPHTSSQTNNAIPVPHGHYADESMRITVVPNRNMVLLAHATAYAIAIGAVAVAYAAHSGDHAIYPDCRPQFVRAMQSVLEKCHFTSIKLYAPYLNATKSDIVLQGRALQAPMHLTYSCYEGREKHCGLCGTCVERKEAFTLAGVTDPTEYEV